MLIVDNLEIIKKKRELLKIHINLVILNCWNILQVYKNDIVIVK